MSSGISLMLGFLLSCKEMISSTASSSFLWSMSIKFSCSLVPAMVPWKLSKPIGWLSLKYNQIWLFHGQKTTHIMSDTWYFVYSAFFKHWFTNWCGEWWWIKKTSWAIFFFIYSEAWVNKMRVKLSSISPVIPAGCTPYTSITIRSCSSLWVELPIEVTEMESVSLSEAKVIWKSQKKHPK